MKMKPMRGHYASVEPEINVTPLVDVVLVLLIIFMVVVPQMQAQRPVELPRVLHPDPENRQSVDPWSITVVRSGEIFIGERAVDQAEVKDVLAELRQGDPQGRVVIRSDASVPWATVRRVLGDVQEVGYPGAALLVSQRKNRTGE